MQNYTVVIQPLVTLFAAFFGAWLANRNFNNQKKKEIEKLTKNLFEELGDIAGELESSIPTMVKTFESLRYGEVNDIASIRLPKNFNLIIARSVFEKIYSELSRQQRADIKVLFGMQNFLDERFLFLMEGITSKDSNLLKKTPQEIIEYAWVIHSCIATSAIGYHYCNNLYNNRLNYNKVTASDMEVINGVLASLNLKLRVKI